MGQDFKATLNADSPRAADWAQVFGGLTVCIESPFPELARLPGFDDPQKIYKVDMALVTDEQRERLVQHLMVKFAPLLRDEAEEALDTHGLPILASECTVVVDNPQRWLGD